MENQTNQTSSDATAQAIMAMRAGKCHHCQTVREEKHVPISAGFGCGMKNETIFVCGNQACSNYGKS